MTTNACSVLVLMRGKRTDQLPQPGRQPAQVAGAAGWEALDSNGFTEHYLRPTRHSSCVVNHVL